MPLAALRLPARKTQTVVLDAATSMDEAKSLASGGMVELVARLSETGDATAGPQAISAPVDAATQPRIELTLTRPRPARPSIALDVSLQEDLDAAVPIFIIARHPSRPGPGLPCGVCSQETCRRTLNSAMRRDAAGPAFVRISTPCRWWRAPASGGTPNAQSGDFESRLLPPSRTGTGGTTGAAHPSPPALGPA